MKITIEVIGEIGGALDDENKLLDYILQNWPHTITSEDVDGTEDWVFLFNNATAEIEKETK